MRELSEDEVFACLRGALRLERTGGGLLPIRFTQDALAYYSAGGEARRVRALCPAGVSIEFLAGAGPVSVAVAMEIGEAARPFAFAELYVDGEPAGTIGSERPGRLVEGGIRIGPSPCDSKRRLSLYLPHCRVASIARIAVEDGGSFEPAPRRKLLLALGDSITQGMTALHPGSAFPVVAARELGMDLHDCGVGGHVFDAASLPVRPAENPALITVAYGTNDWSRGSDGSMIRPYLTRLRELYRAVPIFVLSILWRPDADRPPAGGYSQPRNVAGLTIDEFRARLADAAGSLPGATFVPREVLLPASSEYLFDDIHPNDNGHLLMGRNLAAFIRASGAAP
ncbi:MAG: GDSL-type esterase/lipase family protein [Planctomycetota bacterium]|nr:GDSL-type esterase/lipase family protein [Planctomycetota bacterium]